MIDAFKEFNRLLCLWIAICLFVCNASGSGRMCSIAELVLSARCRHLSCHISYSNSYVRIVY